MGTNYYHIDRDGVHRHIGKSSVGWCFSLHVIPEEGINDLEDWQARWKRGRIEDEDGDKVTPSQMLNTITKRERSTWPSLEWWEKHYGSESLFHDANVSERGPNNLLRHRLGRYVVKHGAGTWDCITSEFS